MQEDVGFLTSIFQSINNYIDLITGGNEFATGLILTGIGSTSLYLARELPGRIIQFLKKHLTTTLIITDDNRIYYQVEKILNKDGNDLDKKSRIINFNSGFWKSDVRGEKSIGNGTQIFRLNKKFCLINVKSEKIQTGILKEMRLTILGRSHKFFDDLLHEAITEHTSPNKIWAHEIEGKDSHIIGQIYKRTFDTIYIEQEKIDTIKNALDNFVEQEERYINLDIPYHFGILLYGPPGTGKTSIAKTIASYLNRDFYLANFAHHLEADTGNGVILLEEIDTLGAKKRQLDFQKFENDENQEPALKVLKGQELTSTQKDTAGGASLSTLSDLLKIMDGIKSPHGRVLITTTNKIDELDEALLRKGRIDLKIEIGYMVEEGLIKMVQKFTGQEIDLSQRKIKDKVVPSDVQADLLNDESIEYILNKYTEELK